MVEDNKRESTMLTSVAMPNTRMMARRSACTILSISPACVDRSRTPSTARKRCTGTATETISSPFSVTRTTAPRTPVSAFITSG
ncbi:hypothetical protein D3C87_1624660 [compost metagenome]